MNVNRKLMTYLPVDLANAILYIRHTDIVMDNRTVSASEMISVINAFSEVANVRIDWEYSLPNGSAWIRDWYKEYSTTSFSFKDFKFEDNHTFSLKDGEAVIKRLKSAGLLKDLYACVWAADELRYLIIGDGPACDEFYIDRSVSTVIQLPDGSPCSIAEGLYKYAVLAKKYGLLNATEVFKHIGKTSSDAMLYITSLIDAFRVVRTKDISLFKSNDEVSNYVPLSLRTMLKNIKKNLSDIKINDDDYVTFGREYILETLAEDIRDYALGYKEEDVYNIHTSTMEEFITKKLADEDLLTEMLDISLGRSQSVFENLDTFEYQGKD